MKKHAKKSGRMPSRKIGRLALIGIILAVLALGATAAVALQKRQASAKRTTPGNDARITRSLRAGAQDVPLDSQTGQVRPLTQEEAQRMADGIKRLVNQSTDGLQYVRHADGSVSVDLQDRFQNIAVQKRNADGTLTQACIDNPEAAANFFEIDPKLVGVQKDPIAPGMDAPLPKGSEK
jgi:hypothetical protein